MTNTELLNKTILESGLKRQYLADKLGITRWGLTKKIENQSEFKASEIVILQEALQLSDDLRDQIFLSGK